MSDLIRRRDAVSKMSDLLMVELQGQRLPTWNDVYQAMNDIPSAEPERKNGKWVPVDSYTAFGGDEMTWLAHGNPIAYHYCSECKNHAYALEDGEDLLSDFCPNCGADMRGE